MTVERENDRNPVIALREIADETVVVDDLRQSLITSLQKRVEIEGPEDDGMEILAAAGSNFRKENAMKTANPPSPPNPGTRKWIGRVGEEIMVGVAGEKIAAVEMLRGRGGAKHDMTRFPRSGVLARRAKEEIGEYLRGERRSFDLPVDLSALTPFSREVLLASERIPYGETRSYAWVAKEAGRPKAARAVGQALHRNPVPLIIP